MIKAVAVVVGLRYRNGAPLYNKTLQTVLGERPCRVIVVSEGSGRPETGASPVLVGACGRSAFSAWRRWHRLRGPTTARCVPSRLSSS